MYECPGECPCPSRSVVEKKCLSVAEIKLGQKDGKEVDRSGKESGF